MRAFLKKLFLFCAIQVALLGAVLWSYYRQYPRHENFLAASIDKQSLIETQASPRLILVGGSSMAFGVNSARIAEACGRHPVNMGLHAAIGLKYMLAEVEPHLKSGDWVIVAPEYQQFGRLSGNSEFLANLIEIEPSNARYLSPDQWGNLFDQGIVHRLGMEVRAVLKHPRKFFAKETITETRAYHRRDGFNANGDVVAHLNSPPAKMSEKKFRLRHDPKSVRDTVAALNHFADVAAQRGAKVWFSHAPLPAPLYEQNRAAVAELDRILTRDVRLPQLDRAEDLVYPFADFFDTWYHLARPGVEKRTEFLASRMREQARLYAAER